MSHGSQPKRQQLTLLDVPGHEPPAHVVTRAELLLAVEAELAAASAGPCALLVVNVRQVGSPNSPVAEEAVQQLLAAMALRLHLATRANDLVCLLGGGEFGVLLRAPAAGQQAIAAAQRLLALAAQPMTLDDLSLVAGVSIGIAVSDASSTVKGLLGEADRALKRAKAAGRNSYELFDTAARSAAVRRSRLEAELRSALHNEELEVHYQPELDLLTGEVLALEALVRWPHPDLGMLAADRFVVLAEEEGMVADLGDWVLRTACETMGSGDLRVSIALRVNVSAHQLGRSLLTQVKDVLADCSLDPQRLCLEITETAVMSNIDCSERVLAELHELGIQLAIDDFGTGFSSLAYLKRFPVDLLKIDRSFVEGVTEPQGRAIVASVLGLAAALDLDVIAEGVENQAQQDALTELGCRRAQGHFFSQALPAQDVLRWISSR